MSVKQFIFGTFIKKIKMGGWLWSLRSLNETNSAYYKTYWRSINYRIDPNRGLHDLYDVSSYQGYYNAILKF